jgi:hypothetical protein
VAAPIFPIWTWVLYNIATGACKDGTPTILDGTARAWLERTT